MKKLLLSAIAASILITSCSKEGYMYNHDYTFDKTKFGYASGSFVVDHVLTNAEEKQWLNEMNQRIIDNLNRAGHNYKLEDIDTSFVYLVRKY